MRNFLTFNNKDSTDFSVWISGSGTFDAPGRDVEMIAVDGRNGDLTVDNGRFKNIDVKYPAFISHDFKENFDAFRAFLLSHKGYQRLEDTYHPEEFRMGIYKEAIKPSVKTLNRSGTFTLTFHCKPQRFLKIGEEKLTFSDEATLINPTLYAALPLVRVYGTGTVGIGANSIEILSADEYTDIDCYIQDAFKGSTNCNSNIRLLSESFFILEPGINGIQLGAGITSIEIVPRWWTI